MPRPEPIEREAITWRQLTEDQYLWETQTELPALWWGQRRVVAANGLDVTSYTGASNVYSTWPVADRS